MSKNVFVGNLDTNVDEKQLQAEFIKIGQVVSIKIVRDEFSKKSLGYGIVSIFIWCY